MAQVLRVANSPHKFVQTVIAIVGRRSKNRGTGTSDSNSYHDRPQQRPLVVKVRADENPLQEVFRLWVTLYFLSQEARAQFSFDPLGRYSHDDLHNKMRPLHLQF